MKHRIAYHLDVAIKAEVHLFVAESRAVKNPRAFIVIILVEAVIEVVGCHAVSKDMSTIGASFTICRTTTLLVATLFEAIAIHADATILEIAVIDGPTVVNQTGIDGIVEIPAVIAIRPAAVAMPLVARSRIELVGKAVSIAAMRLDVVVVVRVAVDDDVITAIEEFGIAVIATVAILVETQLQARIATAIEIATLNDTVAGLEFHATVGRLRDVNVAPVPIIGIGILQHATKLLSGVVSCMWLFGEVEDRIDARFLARLAVIAKDTDAMMTCATVTDVNHIVQFVGAAFDV